MPLTPNPVRISDEPIVAAGSAPGYGPIFNAGLIAHEGVFHLFARGVRDGYRRNDGPGARFLDYISDVLVFTSTDGREYAFQQVLAKGSPEGVHCYEDPRVQRVHTGAGGEEKFVMSYTDLPAPGSGKPWRIGVQRVRTGAGGEEKFVMSYTDLPAPGSGKPWRIGVQRLGFADGRFHLNRTSGRVVGPDGVPNKDAVLFNLRDGRVAMIHRVHPNVQVAVFDSLDDLWSPPAGYWDEHMAELDRHTIITPSAGALGVGAGPPPLLVGDDLLFFFHEREASGQYTAKVALLDQDTGHVVAQLAEPIMRPELPWECVGDVNDVVFVQGAVARPDGTIYLAYGAADRCVGAATVSAAAVVDALHAAA